MADKNKELDTNNLVLLTVAQIDNVMNYVYSNNKEAFDLYFNLSKAKELNKVIAKPKDVDASGTVIADDIKSDNTSNNDKS